MFTGIIESTGTISASSQPSGKEGNAALTIQSDFKSLSMGESVAVEGVCLTVIGKKKRKTGVEFIVDVSEETLKKTTLGKLARGGRVNLERSLRASGRLGGHFVQGHVDATGTILGIEPAGNSKLYTFSHPDFLDALIVPKGSIAVDGISLTVVEAGKNSFSVSVLNHTERCTTLRGKKAGDAVNLEADVLAKVIAKQVRAILQGTDSHPMSGELFQKKEFKWEGL